MGGSRSAKSLSSRMSPSLTTINVHVHPVCSTACLYTSQSSPVHMSPRIRAQLFAKHPSNKRHGCLLSTQTTDRTQPRAFDFVPSENTIETAIKPFFNHLVPPQATKNTDDRPTFRELIQPGSKHQKPKKQYAHLFAFRNVKYAPRNWHILRLY